MFLDSFLLYSPPPPHLNLVTSADEFVLQLLIDKGIVDSAAIQAARTKAAEQPSAGNLDTDTVELLVAEHAVTQLQIAQALAEEFNMDVVDLADVRVSAEALELLPYELANRYKVFPLEADDNEVELAVCDPLDMDAIDSISHVIQRSITCRVAPLEDIEKAIHQYYDGAQADKVDSMFSGLEEVGVDDLDLPTGEEGDVGEDEAPIIRYVHMVISEALKRRASDIHMEPLEKRFRVRYRIDGVLHEVENPPKRLQPSIISRIKLMADVSIAEKRVPLDGRINIKVGPKVIDLRVSTLPTAFGESIVMRILDKEGLNLGLPQLGFSCDDQATFERIIAMPDGVFLVTGPTGSGKSTTLYSALNCINHPDRKIITVEDPVEYEMPGVNQVQVRRDVGMTFSAALLHTNDAPSAISRLVDIGIKPFLVAAALRAVLAQRLVRRICPNCKQAHTPDEKLLSSLGIRSDQALDANFMLGKGCPKCNSTGFRGRVGVFEMFTMSEELQQMVYENASLVALRNKSKEMGMRTMREDGIRKVIAGVTTPEEVLHSTVAEPV